MSGGKAEIDSASRILELLSGKWIAQAVSAAATLGVSDTLGDAELSIEALAGRLECDPGMLERLLAVLVGEGLYERTPSGRYRATASGRMLKSGPDGLGALASFTGSATQWAPWAALSDAIRQGRPAFELTHETGLYEWLDTHPGDARLYDEGIERFTSSVVDALVDRPELADVRQVVDIGGGLGSLVAGLLSRWSHLEAVLLDRAPVLAHASEALAQRGVRTRCQLVAGDLREALPRGGDLYVLKHILHNWSDEDVVRILRGVRLASEPQGRVWIIEGVLVPGTQRSLPRLMDLEMMVLFGRGRARSKAEFRDLLHEAGLSMDRATHPLGGFARLIIARPQAASKPRRSASKASNEGETTRAIRTQDGNQRDVPAGGRR